MANLFEGIQDSLFDVVTNTFGVECSWIPSNMEPDPETGETPAQTAEVLYKSPAEVSTLLGIEYQPETRYIEFKRSVFPGLKELVDAKEAETVTIDGVVYWVRNAYPRFDGQTIIAELIKD